MDSYHSIQQIPIESILNKLKIAYRKFGGCLRLIQDGRVTDGRVGNLSGNYINDFSQNRSKGSNFRFVKSYLKLTSDKETFQWFEQNFHIANNRSFKTQQQIKKQCKRPLAYTMKR